jgi:ferredoxin
MPKVTVVDFMGDCGGRAKCTTCRVTARKGIPRKVTQAQKELFERRIEAGQPQFDAPQVFLSCQVVVEKDMRVSVSEEYNEIIHDSRGRDVEVEITPDPVWLDHEVPDWLGDG